MGGLVGKSGCGGGKHGVCDGFVRGGNELLGVDELGWREYCGASSIIVAMRFRGGMGTGGANELGLTNVVDGVPQDQALPSVG